MDRALFRRVWRLRLGTLGSGFVRDRAAASIPRNPRPMTDSRSRLRIGLLAPRLGNDYQVGHLVLGLAGDVAWVGLEGREGISTFTPFPLPCGDVPPPVGCPQFPTDDYAGRLGLDWVSTVRGRVGAAADGTWSMARAALPLVGQQQPLAASDTALGRLLAPLQRRRTSRRTKPPNGLLSATHTDSAYPRSRHRI